MGKNEDEQALSNLSASTSSDGNGENRCNRCRSIGKIVSLRCVVVMVFGVAVVLSAVFWLPPFFGRRGGSGDSDPDPQFHGADIVASFRVQKPVSLLNANTAKLRYDIFEEIGVPNSSVEILSLEPLADSNWTNVIFGIWSYPKNSAISSAGLSILRENFMSFVIGQSTLHLTASLFGNSDFFQVLKFPGGITVIPIQSAFPLQKMKTLFNFTLNFPINRVQGELGELKAQMKSGLLINSFENVYVILTNLKGSTVAPPTVVQTSIVLAVGNNQPSIPRLRQLAQKIRSSSDGNLGLNHTVFGRVKQIRLSSFLQHSLNGGGNSISLPPSPAPQPHREHHHHRHHHHQHHPDVHVAPAPSPHSTYHAPAPSPYSTYHAPTPSPYGTYHAPAPSDCGRSSPSSRTHVSPAVPPVGSSHHVPAPTYENPPAPTPDLLPAAPFPHVTFAHTRPPSQSVTDAKPPDRMPAMSPSPASSSVAGNPSALFGILAPLLYLLAHL